MPQRFSNNAARLLQSGIAAADTELTLNSVASFPVLSSGDWYYATLIETSEEGQEVAWEIIRVTAAVGNTLTIERGQEGTAAADWPADTVVELRLTAGSVLAPSQLAADLAAMRQRAFFFAGA